MMAGTSRKSQLDAAAQLPLPAREERRRFTIDLESVNPNLKQMEYAVRGPVLDRAMEIEKEILQVYDYITYTQCK